MNTSLSDSAQCYAGFVDDRPVAFCATIHFPHSSSKKLKRAHRTVVLPDYQGVGIGNAISAFVAQLYVDQGYRYFSTTSAPSMIHHRNASPLWRMMRLGSVSPFGGKSVMKNTKTSTQFTATENSRKRITASFEYVGKKER